MTDTAAAAAASSAVDPHAHDEGAPAQTASKRGVRFSIPVLQDIKKAQQEHGLRHDDYLRYRQYCSRRLKRIRKSLKFVNTVKGKYQKREISAKNIDDERHLLMVLVQAERAWSHAMQIREDNAEKQAARPKHHLIRKLRKAVVHAERFERLCADRGDKRTSLEASAYHGWMVGCASLEQEEWTTALARFKEIRQVYESLLPISSGADQDILQGRMDEVEPMIRFCTRNISRLGLDAAAAGDDLMDDMNMAGSGSAHNMLRAKLDRVLAETRKHQAKSLANVNFLGKTVSIRGERLRQSWVTAQDAQFRLSKAGSVLEKMDCFDKVLAAYNDALSVLRGENEGMGKEDSALARAYVQHQILRTTMMRMILLVDEYEGRLAKGEKSLEGRPVTALDLANLFDRLQGDLDDLSRLPVANQDEGVLREVAARSLLFRAARTMWIGESYAHAHNYPEAVALISRAQNIAKAAQERLVQITELRADVERCTNLQERCRGRLCVLRADAAEEAMEKKAEGAATSTKDSGGSAPLSSRLESYEAAAAVGNSPILAEFPPGMEAVPTKPILFDLAFNSVQCPDLSDRIKKKGGVLGWLRR